MSKMTLTEDNVWDYYIQRNLWPKDVDFEHLKDEFRKKGVVILEQKAWYTNGKNERYKVFIESEEHDKCVIVMPDNSRLTVAKSELEEY